MKAREQLSFYLGQQGRDLPGEQYANTMDCITVYIEKTLCGLLQFKDDSKKSSYRTEVKVFKQNVVTDGRQAG